MTNGAEAVAADPDRYRTFWPRVGAFFLDGAALAPLSWMDQVIWNVTTQPGVLLPWVVLVNVATMAYMIGFVAIFGQTPGKMACGVKILDLAGGPVTPWQATLREIVPLGATIWFVFVALQNIIAGSLANRGMGPITGWNWEIAIMFGWTLLEVATMLTNARRRAIHDFIAGTVVVRVPARTGLMWALVAMLVVGLVVSFAFDAKDGNMEDGRRHAGPTYPIAVAADLPAKAADDIVA